MAIALKQCIEILESGQWFSLRFITADVKKGTGGKVIDIAKARIARRFHPVGSAMVPDENTEWLISEARKDPNHSYNATRNIELQNKQLRKVHIILITHINNLPVV